MDSRSSIFESRSFPELPTPALFTSAVMVGSALGDAPDIFRLRQVGSDRFDSATGGLQSCGNFREILLAASHENEIVTALGKAIGVDCADAGRCTSDKSGAFGCGC